MSRFGWSDMILKYKASVIDKCKFVIEFNLPSDELVELAGRYTEPVIIQKSKEQAEKHYHKWVWSVHTFGLKPSSHLLSNDKNHSIRTDQLFSPDSDGNTPKTVILSGDSGRGKSLTLQKIMLDWASGELYSENFDVIYLLKCDEMKCLSQEMSLNQLLSWSCSLTSHQISQILELTPEKVLIIIDGIDQFSFDPPIQIPSPTNPSQQALPMDILRSLLNGQILSESFLLVTTRSDAGTVMNLLKGPQRFTEIVGFSERGVQEYFQKIFQDEQLFRKTYESVKINESLLTACSVPLLCWMVCFCLKKHFTDDDRLMRELKTTTSIYVHFVSTLLEHHDQSQTVLTMLRSLGQLAEEGMKKQQVFFDEKSVAKTGLDPATNVFLYKGSLKIKDKQEPVFRFMHFSFQEFFTALYYVLLDEEMSRWKISNLLHRVEVGDEIYRPSPERSNPFLSDMMFFCGLLNEEVSSSIFEKIKETVPYNMKLKKTLQESLLGMTKYHECERLFVLHCLYELQDEIIVREALKTHRFMNLSNISLRSTDCWVLLYCLQCCSHIRDLDLMYCDLTAEKLMILQPALCMCRNLSLSVENLLEAGDLIRSLCESKILRLLRVQEDEYSAESPRWTLDLLFRRGDVSLFLSSSEENPSFPAVLNIRLTCPQSEISSTDWILFFQRLSKRGKLADDSSALDEHVSSLLSSFHSVSLKALRLKLVVLNKSWASGIISLAQTYTSLQELSVSVTGLLLEEGLMLLKKSLTDPHCTVIIKGRKCSKPTDQCKEQDWSHSCNENVVIHFKSKGLKKMRGTAIDLESAELQDFGFSETLFGFTSPPTTPPRTIRRSFFESAASPGQEPFLRLLVRAQGRRRNEQRAGTGNSLPGLRTLPEHSSTSSRQMILSQVMASTDATEPDDQMNISDSEPNLQPLPVCQSCVHIGDSDQWVQVEPLACTDEGRSEFRISTLAGRFECSRTRMRWVCAGDVTLQYRAVDGCFLSEELERLQCERIGPVIDVTVISGKLEEAHLPHYACLAESDPSLRDAVKLLSVEEEGISLESVELTRFHAKILQPYFSPKTVLMKLGISVKVHCDLLIFMTHKNPIILHVYFFPIDSVFEEKIKTEKKSCHQISLSRPETPLQMMKQHSLEVPGASVQPEAIKLRGDIDPNFFQVKHPVVDDIKMSLSRVDDQKSVWTATIWKELINMHPNRAETLFQTGQNQNTPHLAVNFDKVQFFDRNWCDLIKSVENVNNIADKLLRKQIIHDELYSEITHPTSTSEASMRKICSTVRKGSDTVKEMFISILLEENPDLLNHLPLVDS